MSIPLLLHWSAPVVLPSADVQGAVAEIALPAESGRCGAGETERTERRRLVSVGGPRAGGPPLIAGRIEELGALGQAIGAAAEGEPCAVFVHGEAGVGKTRLVRRVCHDAAQRGFVVLWGQCVRFGAVESPYVPIATALQRWLDEAEPRERAAVLDVVDGVAELLPALGGHRPGNVRLLTVVDAFIAAIVAQGPTVLVIDDAHWADLSSRDALAYLVAGFRHQRLAIITTHRDEDLVAGHPLHGWLADLRRLLSVTEMRLARLSQSETEQQLVQLMGGPPQPGLAAEVHRRSDGNPYLSELLVTGLTQNDEHLRPDLPVELTDALLAAWHRLSATARETTRLLALAGRPTTLRDLITVAARHGLAESVVAAAVAEATDCGIVRAHGLDACWFRHPLLADVLAATLAPGTAAPIHAAWAATLEASVSVGLDELRRQGDLALHYEAANQLGACFRASLRAADLAKKLNAPREAAVHLRRTARLWPTVDHSQRGDRRAEARLAEDLARTSHMVGDGQESLAAWHRALSLIDPASEPRRASVLLIEASYVEFELGLRETEPINEVRRAVDLTVPFLTAASTRKPWPI